ncbi:nitrile hydratase subunit alpha [Mycobacterium heidelbergense]|uniref:nitrile hydratase subunit alpha n=1 Tax=Mycobacterium heidelbergense TaxID=53376 RepID=UPI003CF01AD4
MSHNHAHTDPLRAHITARVAVLEQRLIERGAITGEQLDDVLEMFTARLGAHHGARYVARAWTDPIFKRALLDDATAVVRQYGYDLRGARNRELPFLHLEVVENTADVHNLVVCTLCSCYPIALLGPSPSWYKSIEYRARAVREPRAVLAEFGTHLEPAVQVRVWDSTADCRYLVLPRKPAGCDHLTEEQLAAIVTQACLTGTTQPIAPSPPPS